MNIIIADDHALIAKGIMAYFENVTEYTFFSATNKGELIQLLDSHKIDLILQDIQFGDDDGRKLKFDLQETYPTVKFVAISSFTDEFTVQSTISAGFEGYVSKSAPLSEIELALDTIKRNEVFISSDIKDKMIQTILTGKREDIFLTIREKQVLAEIQNGFSTKEIAKKLIIAEKTVEGYRANLFLKFDVKNAASLVKIAILKGYIS